MQVIDNAPSVNTDDIAPPRVRRALEIQVAALETEQREAADQHEALYQRAKAILDQMEEREQQLRVFRALLDGGRHA